MLLFDVDGTLITSGGAGRRAMERAFVERLGQGPWLDFPLGGMTDRAILRMALRNKALPQDEATMDDLIERYLQRLEGEVERASGYSVHPGVVPLLDRASRDPKRWAVGLGTGNVRRGAEIKLARGNLNHYFTFGGFGCDHENRVEVLRIGARRGAAVLGQPPESCRVVVIGDTPKDVVAALAMGARCVGVGTGNHESMELTETGASAAFADLAQSGAMEAILLGRVDGCPIP